MVGIVRNRTLTGVYAQGVAYYDVSSSDIKGYLAENKVMSDVVGNPKGINPLTLNNYRNVVSFLNGTNGLTGVSRRDFQNYPPSYFSTFVSHLTQQRPFRDATQAIAETNPGEPAVSVPNFLYELKDVPSMLRHAAERARRLHHFWLNRGMRVSHRRLAKYYDKRSAGEDYLNYIFGWLPFFSDLSDILDLSEFTEKRAKKFRSIKNNELRSTGTLGTDEVQATTRPLIQSFLVSIRANSVATTKFQRWYSAIYDVDSLRFGAALNGSTRRQLMDALGFDNSLPIQIWEAMPWSWMSDWFFNVGSLIKLKGNRQGCRFRNACIMTHTTTLERLTPIGPPSYLKVNPGERFRDTKLRAFFTPSFLRTDGGYNIFQPSHLAILASLKVTRGRGSSSF